MNQHDVSVLSEAKKGLLYLTANDWALVADKAARVAFKKGETLVYKGKPTDGIYLLLKGSAKAQLPSRLTLVPIGAGEVCGEISFLDGLPASADVVAYEDVEAYFLDRSTLQSLFELFPHLASRFYRSLATNLASRLRNVIGSRTGAVAK